MHTKAKIREQTEIEFVSQEIRLCVDFLKAKTAKDRVSNRRSLATARRRGRPFFAFCSGRPRYDASDAPISALPLHSRSSSAAILTRSASMSGEGVRRNDGRDEMAKETARPPDIGTLGLDKRRVCLCREDSGAPWSDGDESYRDQFCEGTLDDAIAAAEMAVSKRGCDYAEVCFENGSMRWVPEHHEKECGEPEWVAGTWEWEHIHDSGMVCTRRKESA